MRGVHNICCSIVANTVYKGADFWQLTSNCIVHIRLQLTVLTVQSKDSWQHGAVVRGIF